MALALPDRSRPALPLLQVGELSAGAFRSVPMQQVDKGPCEQFGWVGGDSADSETYLLQVFMRRIARYVVYPDLLQTCCVFIFKIL